MKALLNLRVHVEFLRRLTPYYEHWEEILKEALRKMARETSLHLKNASLTN